MPNHSCNNRPHKSSASTDGKNRKSRTIGVEGRSGEESKSQGKGDTGKPQCPKHQTARRICKADVTSNRRFRGKNSGCCLVSFIVSMAFSHVLREASSVKMAESGIPSVTRNLRATSASDGPVPNNGSVPPLRIIRGATLACHSRKA